MPVVQVVSSGRIRQLSEPGWTWVAENGSLNPSSTGGHLPQIREQIRPSVCAQTWDEWVRSPENRKSFILGLGLRSVLSWFDNV